MHSRREGHVLRTILIFGAIAGVAVGVPLSTMVVLNLSAHGPYGLLLGYTIMLIALSAVFAGIKRHRDRDLGGVIGFWRALALGLGISVVAGIFYVAAWETALALTHLDFAGSYAQAQIVQEKAKGISGAALAKFVAEMEQFKTNYANPFYRYPMTFVEIFPVGVLVSLVSAGLLRNSRFLPARTELREKRA
jgi:hypothetical protein